MTEQIKNRITEIDQGKVPDRYKKTQVGIIPKEWITCELSDVSKIFDGTHETPNYTNEGVRFVSVENIKNILSSDKYISKNDFSKFLNKPQNGDILMTRITAGIIGETTIVTSNDPLAYYVSLALIRSSSNIYNIYLERYINGVSFKKELDKRIIHTAYPKKINLGDIGKCYIAYPSNIDEQHKIADFLKKMEEAIFLQEQLIKKLEKQKKAMMQRLLTPKEDWEITSLSECCRIRKGEQLNGEELLDNGKYKMINGGIAESGYTDKYNSGECIVISEGGNSCGFVNYVNEEFWCGGIVTLCWI